MDLDLSRIDEFFPMREYRPGQKWAIEQILKSFNDDYKFVFLEAPTGSGKSAIGFTVAQFFKYSYYLAPQKFLQDQLVADFGEIGRNLGRLEPMIDLKGRNAYPCNFWERILSNDGNPEVFNEVMDAEKRKKYAELAYRKHGCEAGECKRRDSSSLAYCNSEEAGTQCPYFKRLYRALMARVCLMNFHSFLFQSSVTMKFGNRNLLIIDEAHNAEDVLLKFIEFSVSDRLFQGDSIKFPCLRTVADYVEYFTEIKLRDRLAAKRLSAIANEDIRGAEEIENIRLKLDMLLESDPNKWVCIWEEVESKASRKITIKPIHVDEYANKYLFSKADYVLFMSATILQKNAMCDCLGIMRDGAKSFRLPSSFPVENRRLYYRSCGSMSYAHKNDTMPEVISEINHLCNHHKDQRGIIHTHNFEIANRVMEECEPGVRRRFLFQKQIEFSGNKQALLDKHKQTPNSIIVAPAMHEGLDLKDDLGRFQILCKVPYPTTADPQIAARMAESEEYYNWLTAVKLIQSYGRIYRHEKDHGVTYVLDRNFRSFVDDNAHMMPKWFLEAIIWE